MGKTRSKESREREREQRQKKAQLAREQKARVIAARNAPLLVILFSYGVDAVRTTMCQDGYTCKAFNEWFTN